MDWEDDSFSLGNSQPVIDDDDFAWEHEETPHIVRDDTLSASFLMVKELQRMKQKTR